MEFKDALRNRRIRLGLTPDQLARMITRNGSPTTAADVELWERGRNFPPLELSEFREALAAALQTTVDKIEKGMRPSLRASEPEQPLPPPLPPPRTFSPEAIRAAELVDALPSSLRLLAVDILGAMYSSQQQTVSYITRVDFWDS